MTPRDDARCANEDCPRKTRCARFGGDAVAHYARFAIGVDGECDGYIKPPRKAIVGLRNAALAIKRSWKAGLSGL